MGCRSPPPAHRARTGAIKPHGLLLLLLLLLCGRAIARAKETRKVTKTQRTLCPTSKSAEEPIARGESSSFGTSHLGPTRLPATAEERRALNRAAEVPTAPALVRPGCFLGADRHHHANGNVTCAQDQPHPGSRPPSWSSLPTQASAERPKSHRRYRLSRQGRAPCRHTADHLVVPVPVGAAASAASRGLKATTEPFHSELLPHSAPWALPAGRAAHPLH